MFLVFWLCFLVSVQTYGQYEDYESYQTFTDLDREQRDFGLVFSPSLIYLSIDESNAVSGQTVNNRSRNVFLYDVKLGYIFHGGFYFGIMYGGDSQDINSSSPTTTRESVGLTFGYVHHGWSFLGSFFPYSKQTVTGATDVAEYSNGLGFQVDIAYFFRLGPYVSIGPQLVYKSINYGEAEAATGNTDSDAQSQHTLITPMVSFLFNLYRG